jgi:hypothetical protein
LSVLSIDAKFQSWQELTSVEKGISGMRLTNKIKEAGATGYILLWLLGIPIPILFLVFLLRGCN